MEIELLSSCSSDIRNANGGKLTMQLDASTWRDMLRNSAQSNVGEIDRYDMEIEQVQLANILAGRREL